MKRWLRNVSQFVLFSDKQMVVLAGGRERTPDGACMERIPYDGCASHAVFRISRGSSTALAIASMRLHSPNYASAPASRNHPDGQGKLIGPSG